MRLGQLLFGLKKNLIELNEKPIYGFLLWFCISIILSAIFYDPFNQPIRGDRAYLMYMSQEVYRGNAIYSSTTFGYTPLSTLAVGYLMKFGALFGLNTIATARIVGLALYGFISGTIFILLAKLFKDNFAPTLGAILFIGFGFIQIIAGVSAEPKIFVLAFTNLGMIFLIQRKWLLVGLFFSAAAMS